MGVFVAGENQHADILELFGKPAQEIDAVQPGQFGVEYDQIGLHLQAERQGALAIARLTDELVVGVQAEDFRQHLADGGLIFNDDEALHFHGR